MVLARPGDVKASDTKNKDGVTIDAEEQAWARQAGSHTTATGAYGNLGLRGQPEKSTHREGWALEVE